LPPAGQWVRLEVPAALVGLEGEAVVGMNHGVYDGRAVWDRSGARAGDAAPTTHGITGQIQADGAPLAGVGLGASAGANCTATDANGSFGCTVPVGWSGTITPQAVGYAIEPTSRVYSDVRLDLVGQDFTATAVNETVWMDDSVPAGAVTNAMNDSWRWVTGEPLPYAGTRALGSVLADGRHQQWWQGAGPLAVGAGDVLYVHVWLDPSAPPRQIWLEWRDADGSWLHAAYWGEPMVYADHFLDMGALPPAGQWVRLEVPAALVGLEGEAVVGMNHGVYDGRAVWDRSGSTSH
jgi:hypothetical protein